MIDVPDRPYVYVRLRPVKLFLRHFSPFSFRSNSLLSSRMINQPSEKLSLALTAPDDLVGDRAGSFLIPRKMHGVGGTALRR